MNRAAIFLIVVIAFVLSSCNRSIKVEDIQIGDKFGTFTVSDIKVDNRLNISFKEEVELEGVLYNNATMIRVKTPLFDKHIAFKGKQAHLKEHLFVHIKNTYFLPMYLNKKLVKYSKKGDQTKEEYIDSIPVKLNIRNLSIIWNHSEFKIEGDIVKLISLNNETPIVSKRNLKTYKRKNQNLIRFLIYRILKNQRAEETTTYTANYRNFYYYTHNEELKRLMNWLDSIGYKITQEKGAYLLEVEE